MKFLAFLTTILLIALVALGVFAGNQNNKVTSYKKENQDLKLEQKSLKEDNESLVKQLAAKKNNQEEKVKEDTTEFLEAFFNYDTGKGERSWVQIKPYVTDKALEKLTPPGSEENPKKTSPETSVVSELAKKTIYYTPVSNAKANVFVRVYQKITINKVSSENQILLDIQLVYDNEKQKWVVDDAEMQQPLQPDGFVN